MVDQRQIDELVFRTTGNELLDRINKIVLHLERKKHPARDAIGAKLERIRRLVEQGAIMGPEEFNLLDFHTPKILSKCQYLSPLGECRLGLSEYCGHRGEWENGECSCRKYQPRE